MGCLGHPKGRSKSLVTGVTPRWDEEHTHPYVALEEGADEVKWGKCCVGGCLEEADSLLEIFVLYVKIVGRLRVDFA